MTTVSHAATLTFVTIAGHFDAPGPTTGRVYSGENMKPYRLLLFLNLAIAAIASTACSDSDNPCANLDCATGLSSINLTVIDGATGAAIDQPTFLVNGTLMQATCLPAEDASATCARWSLLFGSGGTYTIDVHAMGYVNTSVTVQLAGPNPDQCCGSGSSTDATVSMQMQ